MAAIEQPAGFANVLLVTARDILDGDNRQNLRNVLYNAPASESPVRQGTHDLWITYAVPPQGSGEWGFEDLSTAPRKLRGIVRMGSVPPNLLEATVRDHLSVMLQEVGHHWLVPGNLGFDVGNGVVTVSGDLATTQAINDESPYSGPLLVARGNQHWSAYWQADASPLDGLYFVKQGEEDGHVMWEARDLPGPVLSPAGLAPVLMRSSYNDLDRVIMGTKPSAEAYASDGNRIRWLEPRLSAPHQYHAGLFVAFSQFDFIVFGFHEDHRVLGVQRTGGSVATTTLGAGYRPLADELNAVALRIVRRGQSLHFQARYDVPPAGLPDRLRRPPQLGDDLDVLAPVGRRPAFDATTFRTVATMTVANRPRAIGVILKKWDTPHLAELAFQHLVTFAGGRSQVWKTDRVPPRFPPGAPYDQLRRGDMRLQIPVPGPLVPP
jgi:hypothetical protein